MGRSEETLLPLQISFEDFKSGTPLSSEVFVLDPSKNVWKKRWLRLPAEKGHMGYGRLQVFKNGKEKNVVAIHDLDKCQTQNLMVADEDLNQFSLLVPGHKVERLGKKAEFQATTTLNIICPGKTAMTTWVNAIWLVIATVNPSGVHGEPPSIYEPIQGEQRFRTYEPPESIHLQKGAIQKSLAAVHLTPKSNASPKTSMEKLPVAFADSPKGAPSHLAVSATPPRLRASTYTDENRKTAPQTLDVGLSLRNAYSMPNAEETSPEKCGDKAINGNEQIQGYQGARQTTQRAGMENSSRPISPTATATATKSIGQDPAVTEPMTINIKVPLDADSVDRKFIPGKRRPAPAPPKASQQHPIEPSEVTTLRSASDAPLAGRSPIIPSPYRKP